MPSSHFTGLPLGSLLSLLEQEGFDLSPDRVLRIEHALLNMPFDPKRDPVNSLKLYLAPLVAQDKDSQAKFYSQFTKWEKTLVQQEPNPTPKPKPNEEIEKIKRGNARRIAVLISLIVLLAIGLFAWMFWPKPLPPRHEAIFGIYSTCLAVGSELRATYLSPDTTLPFRWDFSDGHVDSSSLQPVHRYTESGEYTITLIILDPGREDTAIKTIFVRPAGPAPAADFQIDSLGENRYRLIPLDPDTLAFTYSWGFATGESDNPAALQPVVRFEPNKLHYLSLTVGVAGTSAACEVKTTQRLDLRKELITLEPALSARMDDELQRSWTLLAWLLPLALALLGWLGWLAYGLWRRRLPKGPTLDQAFNPGNGPPIFLDFPDTEAMPVANDSFHDVANRMRQRGESDTEKLDVPASLRATIQNAGFPDFRYQRPSRATEFLALVQTQGEEDQQARLFTRFLQRLQAEQVAVDIWYFQDDLRACFQPGRKHISLSRLLDTYGNARLLIYGNPSALLAPMTVDLLPGLERLLSGWEHKAWFTPQPPADWAQAEREAAKMFLLLPADLDGQLESMESWQDRQDFDFRALQRHFMRQQRLDALSDYDFRQIAGLKAWLGAERFQWLAATALYPRPVWEITLAMGMALSPEQADFDDLMRLTSIPWLQHGDLSETLRAELVAELSPDTEQRAREVLRDLLHRADPPEQSFAAQEKAIQLTVQEAFLQPDDPGKREALRLLWEKGLLDPLPRLHLRREQIAREVRQRHRRTLLAGWTTGLALLGWLALTLTSSPAGSTWQQLGLVKEQPLDSLAWYVNATADSLDAGDTLSTRSYAARASALAPEQAEVRYNLMALDYLRGRLTYQRWKFEAAQPGFEQAATAATEGLGQTLPGYEALPGGRDEATPDAAYLLLQHSLHGLGLSRYYAGNTAGAEAIRKQMDPAYFEQYSPNLLTLLGGEALRQQVQQALREADSLYNLLWPGLQQAQSLDADTETDIRRLREAYLQVQALDAENTLATARLEELRSFQASLLPSYKLQGQVLDDSTGQPLAGVTVGWWNGEGLTGASGRFEMQVQEEARDGGRVLLQLQKEGYQTLNTEVALPADILDPRMKRLPKAPASPDSDNLDKLRKTLDLALKEGRCTEVDSLLDLLATANAPDIYDYRAQREEVCNDTVPPPLILPQMVRVTGGTFEMGSKDGESNEKPPHPVTVSDFYLGRYEVTNEEYASFLNAYGSDEVKAGAYAGQKMIYEETNFGLVKNGNSWQPVTGKEQHPVVYVTWYGATEYATWLREQTGQRWRLPTEAEWEYAAGGGVGERTRYAGTDNDSELGNFAWYDSNSGSTTHAVGSKRPNSMGLYDMSGNVYEWCADWYGKTYYGTLDERKSTQNPKGPPSGSYRVLRGGSWGDDVYYCRVSLRSYNVPDDWNGLNGFRLARD